MTGPAETARERFSDSVWKGKGPLKEGQSRTRVDPLTGEETQVRILRIDTSGPGTVLHYKED